MNTIIYTFSGTGTALSIANQLRNAIEAASAASAAPAAPAAPVASVELIPGLPKDEVKAEAPVVGFVFPNYFGGIPNIVRSFVRRLDMANARYIFSIVTAGGGQGYSLKFLQEELQEKGKTLNYGRYVKGLSNYIVAGYYKLLSETGEKRDKTVDSLREKTSLYADEIIAEKQFVERSNPVIYSVNRFLSNIASHDVINDTSGGDKDYSAGGGCTGCGTCKGVCQANNIVMTDNKPEFLHECYRCMACIQYCPRKAILYKGKELTAPRCTHPDYPAETMISRTKEKQSL